MLVSQKSSLINQVSVLCFLRLAIPATQASLALSWTWQHLLWWFLLIPPGRQPRRPDQNASWQWKAIISEEKKSSKFHKKFILRFQCFFFEWPKDSCPKWPWWRLQHLLRWLFPRQGDIWRNVSEVMRFASAQADRIAWMRRFLVALELWSKPWFLGFGRHN